MKYPIKRAEKYTQAVARGMGLSDWDVGVKREVLTDQTEDGVFILARCLQTYGRDQAHVQLSETFFEHLSPEEQRDTIVHELLHCHIDYIIRATDALETQLNPPVWHLFRTELRERMEIITDRIARALAPKFPLPDFTPRKYPTRDKSRSHPSRTLTPSRSINTVNSGKPPGDPGSI